MPIYPGLFFSLLLSFARGLWTSSGRVKKKAAMSDWPSSATQWSGVVEHLQASQQARRAVARKKPMTEEMSMEDLWPRQSVHGWVLFLGIKSVYNDYKQRKWKASASVRLLLATAVARCSRRQALFWCYILTLTALSLLSHNVGSLLSAIFTFSELLRPPDVMESVLLSHHLQIPLLQKARPRDGH